MSARNSACQRADRGMTVRQGESSRLQGALSREHGHFVPSARGRGCVVHPMPPTGRAPTVKGMDATLPVHAGMVSMALFAGSTLALAGEADR
jgi:hypothetical protein